MSHYVANEHSGYRVGDLKDLEEVTADSGGGAEEMVKSQRARLRRSRTGKSRISLRQQSVLQLARRLEVLFSCAFFLRSSSEYLASCSSAFFRAVMSRVVDTNALRPSHRAEESL